MKNSVNVRTIAETYYEGGDLETAAAALDRMQEGLKGHLLIQNTYTSSYRAEVPVSLDVESDGIELTVQGRIDGLRLEEGLCEVEEIKTTRRPPAEISENDYPVHWAQAEIYGHIVCVTNDLPGCTVRLVYSDLSGGRKVFIHIMTAEELKSRFYEYLSAYIRVLKRRQAWLDVSVPGIKQHGFPFTGYRPGQRELAADVYRAVRDRSRLLCQAPTGIGKTAATLFPAVKALGEGLTDTVFYLTARTTGRLAAENALKLINNSGLPVRWVSISAKRKLCPTPGLSCDPRFCPRAKGYFDRQKEALEAAYGRTGFDAEAVNELAEEFDLCPFELNLALSQTAQVIVCDYNYVFDPAVRLKRFFDHKGRYTLLIDEAHNLPDRAREMYSAEIGDKEVRELRRAVGKAEGKECTLYTSLTAVLKSLPKTEECELVSELPLKPVEALKAFSDAAKDYLSKPRDYHDALTDLFFAAAAFIRVSGEYDEETYKTMQVPEGKTSRLRLWCWNPSPALDKVMKKMRGTVMFSATLSPLTHYSRLLNVDADKDGKLLDLPSPFPRENLLSLCLDIPTRFSKREESAPQVARAIHAMALSRKGNYLACFPSHAYLNRVAELLSAMTPRVDILLQKTDMTDAGREEYLSRFTENPPRSMVAFIAMGGVFSEGIDLPGDKLIGAAVVGVGLPQICFERDALKLLYDDDEGNGGFETAYVYPGMGKCLQAAGRVIRTETDRGAVLFIDERYLLPEYSSLMPPHIRPVKCSADALGEKLKRFWEKG